MGPEIKIQLKPTSPHSNPNQALTKSQNGAGVKSKTQLFSKILPKFRGVLVGLLWSHFSVQKASNKQTPLATQRTWAPKAP